MRVALLHPPAAPASGEPRPPDRSLLPELALPAHESDLRRDLELDVILDAMAQRDPVLREIAHHGLLTGLRTVDAIRYRQHVLADCLRNPTVLREFYAVTAESIRAERRAVVGRTNRSPEGVVRTAAGVLDQFVATLRRLRALAADHGAAFRSDGLRDLMTELTTGLDESYLDTVTDHLQRLRFRDGVLASARLGEGNRGTGYVVHDPLSRRRPWLPRLGAARRAAAFEVANYDEVGLRELAKLRGDALRDVAATLATATEHILGFLQSLRAELGFYVGCVNLSDALRRVGTPTCLPDPVQPNGSVVCTARGLRDIAVALQPDTLAVGNDLDADGRQLVVVTGANSGGKSTFLRSYGAAVLMMHAGMFVAADSFTCDVFDGVVTHFPREEDTSMQHGKLDEELRRMSDVVATLGRHDVVLCNESFATTDEREGAQLGSDIVRALCDAGHQVVLVTHLYSLARDLLADGPPALSLRAERDAAGVRTYRLVPGQPQPTSHGDDIYARVFSS
ncbi:MAG: DNA mismatch repair protein MutS [Actinomycetota bacterium]|nr:MAG: DNA mismatch repair protein MutS [Actinomycetota bacterium]